MNAMFIIVVFFICATCKTKTRSAVHHVGFFCVLQALKPQQQATLILMVFSLFLSL
jgi:hypothetical protein